MERIEKARVWLRLARSNGAVATVELGTAYVDDVGSVMGAGSTGTDRRHTAWDRGVEDPWVGVELLEVHAEGASQLDLAQAEQTIGRLQARERSLTGDLLAAREEADRYRTDAVTAHERVAALEAEIAALQRLLRKGDGGGGRQDY